MAVQFSVISSNMFARVFDGIYEILIQTTKISQFLVGRVTYLINALRPISTRIGQEGFCVLSNGGFMFH